MGNSRTLPLVISFGVIALDELVQRTSQEASPNKISFDRHSCFTERTHLSAKAFRFGLRAGNWIGLIPPDVSVARNESQNLVSRSCSAYRLRSRFPRLSPVALRAICSIQDSSGCSPLSRRAGSPGG